MKTNTLVSFILEIIDEVQFVTQPITYNAKLRIRKIFLITIGFLFAVLVAQIDAYGFPVNLDGQALPSLAPMLERAMPAVVNISTRTEIQVREHPLMRDPFFRQFFGDPGKNRKRQSQSLGSGVIIDKKYGYVLTNNHVIDKADQILVTLHDGRQLNAEVVGTDPESDVAVIRIPNNNITQLPIANSSHLRVGDFVVAIGNPFGLGQTVTSGIISALGRSGLGIEGYEDFIQTDASINPGNSGGALVNLRGELIGINTAIIAPSGGNVGIGFAIPTNMAMQLKKSLVKHGKVRRGLLGVGVQDLTPELSQAFELENQRGAVITRVQANSPAERARLVPGDIIIAVNTRPVKNSAAVRNAIGLMQIGDRVKLEIIHQGERVSRSATIAKPNVVGKEGGRIHRTLVGTVLTETQRHQVEGVLFSDIDTSSYAWSVGLRPGDIVVKVNYYRIRNIQDLKTVASRLRVLQVSIQRDDESLFVLLQ